jgi:hypothetical protein
MNPNNAAYSSSRSSTEAAADNRANQLNPNNDAHWQSRGVQSQPGEESAGYMGAPMVERVSVPPPDHGAPPAPTETRMKKAYQAKLDDDW